MDAVSAAHAAHDPMKPIRPFQPLLLLAALLIAIPPCAPGQTLPRIPADLVQDDHVREEFGINTFTTPSIEKLFDALEQLGDVPYDTLKRPIPETPPPADRSLIALGLGVLIADGFLIVQAEKFNDFEMVGRAVVRYAKPLGADTNITRHVKSALELGTGGEWDKLKRELAATQADVEAEMVQLRDVEVAHLIALGGWLRAVEIVCSASLSPFDASKASALRRVDIVDYFLQELSTLKPSSRELEHILNIETGVKELRAIIAAEDPEKKFTKDELEKMRATVGKLVNISSNAPQATASN